MKDSDYTTTLSEIVSLRAIHKDPKIVEKEARRLVLNFNRRNNNFIFKLNFRTGKRLENFPPPAKVHSGAVLERGENGKVLTTFWFATV